MKISKIIFTTGAMLFALLLVIGCSPKNQVQNKGETEEQLFAVSTLKTVAGNLDEYLEFGGDIASVNSVSVLPDQGGKVTNILVSVGDLVKRGQTIAYVNPLRVGAIYNDSPVNSPISGRIISIPTTVGSTVSQSSPIANVARTDDLEVKINIAERFISRISAKQKAIITFDAYPSVEFPATVFEVSPVLDTSTRTMGVKLRFDKEDSRVKVGMYGRVKLITDSVKNAIVVPSSAIITRDSKNYIYVVEPHTDKKSTVKFVPVTVGITVDNKTEISQGLKVGDEIVIKGMSLLSDGAKVNVTFSRQAE
ncbi:efflux RND transporter periplasmic adaptor subunit [Treponema pectinovorum]|uniref:efflux RND transporter periplasmic adaptor subunit n=1 Tax=Treponema pectinovorum TaxID=164 RepID=UPI0011C8C4F9|nr:efflux RND transporter periplasmic adaptor subunit [Treponema pectinovorum]